MNQRLLPLLCFPALLATAAAVAQTEPGEEWTNTTEMQMQGMSMGPRTMTSCVPVNSTEPPAGPEDQNCEMYDVVRSGSKTSWKMRCKSDPPTTGSGEITYQGRGSYQGTMTMNMDGQTMTMKMSGTNTGKACDAGKIRRDMAKQQAQSDRMLAQQCAEAARGMQVMMFDGSYPSTCDAKYKTEFCTRMSTEEGYDILAVGGRNPMNNMTSLESAQKACGVDAGATRARLCQDAVRKDSLTFMARHCPDEAAPLAQKECAGRTFTSPPAERYREFCSTYGQHRLGAGDAAPDAGGSGDAASGQSTPPDAPASKEGAVEQGKKALKKLFPF
jgi:hypothetical protein